MSFLSMFRLKKISRKCCTVDIVNLPPPHRMYMKRLVRSPVCHHGYVILETVNTLCVFLHREESSHNTHPMSSVFSVGLECHKCVLL